MLSTADSMRVCTPFRVSKRLPRFAVQTTGDAWPLATLVLLSWPLLQSRSLAVSVSGNWRLTFYFEGQDAALVDYQDYR